MKKYVILTPTISNMGGAQMYVRNKQIYYKKQGWNSCIIAGQGENICIPELNKFPKTYYELNFCSYMFSEKVQKRIESELINTIYDDKYSEIVIESTSITTSTWAELVAKKIRAKHLVFLLQERNDINNTGLLEFLKFKYKRKELAGITVKTIRDMFAPFFLIDEKLSYSLSAHCNNVVENVDSPILQQICKIKYNHIIGCLSRLDKPFVLPALNDFKDYADSHPNMRFLLLLIGNIPHGQSTIFNSISSIFSKTNNVEYIITGYLYPIPTKLLEICDAFFCSAGSCRVCMASGVPTISYDGKDFKPIGVMGHTTKNSLFRDTNEPAIAFSILMDEILVENKYSKIPADYNHLEPDFRLHSDFINNSAKDADYFEIKSLCRETKTDRNVSFMLALIGANMYGRLRKYKFSKWLKHKTCD